MSCDCIVVWSWLYVRDEQTVWACPSRHRCIAAYGRSAAHMMHSTSALHGRSTVQPIIAPIKSWLGVRRLKTTEIRAEDPMVLVFDHPLAYEEPESDTHGL